MSEPVTTYGGVTIRDICNQMIKLNIRKGGEVHNESLSDSVLDLACYAVMYLVGLENREDGN